MSRLSSQLLPFLSKNKRIVLKIGSRVIASRKQGLDQEKIKSIATEVAALRGAGYFLFIVSSGAILAGTEKLGFQKRPMTLPMKQAAASVGQSRLIWAYEKIFESFNIKVAQVLLTGEDVADRKRFINARNTLMTLLSYDVLPIINENDTVSVDEIKFGDNDRLAAQVAYLIDAALLILMTDIDGLYTADPRKNRDATMIPVVTEITHEIEAMAGGASSTGGGTGGMISKIVTAKQMAANGVATLILNGTKPGQLRHALLGERGEIGTLFLPKPIRPASKKQWIAYSSKTKGAITLDAGAVKAIQKGGKSLLPSGVCSVTGKFAVGDAIRCLSPDGVEVAVGLTNYGAPEMIQLIGAHSSEIQKKLGHKSQDEVIHRDNMVIHRGR